MESEAAPYSYSSEIDKTLTERANRYNVSEKLRRVIEEIIRNIENYCTGPTGCNFHIDRIKDWVKTPALSRIMDSYELIPEERELITFLLCGKENVN